MAADLLAFPFVGGRHALNFVGTLGKRGFGDIERLRTPDDLVRWAAESGLGRPSAPADLEAARRLREAIYGLLLASLGRAPARAADVAQVNEWAARPTAVPELILRSGSFQRCGSGATASAVLAVVARDAIDLLTGAEAASIRDCEDPTCTLLFVDTSRGHRRRWCSMDRCGARAKMRTLRSPS
jgi:predicted RNA-binding Zn ribbon-like protein